MTSQPTDPTTQKRPPLSPFRKLLVAAAGVILLILGLIYWQPINRYITVTWHCLTTDCDPKGPAVPWEDQFAAAENTAHKIDPGALLTGIEARPAFFGYKAWQPNDALDVTFHYITADGGELHVTIWDSAPSHVEIRQSGNDRLDLDYYRTNLERKADLYTILARIQLSPRQALELTRATALEQIPGKDIRPLLDIFLYGMPTEPQKWSVFYTPLLGNKPAYTGPLLGPTFNVDATSGAVEDVSITEKSLRSTP